MIIVDDGSCDDTSDVVSRYAISDSRIRYIKMPSNIGTANARNVGIRSAKGRYIAFLDNDDLWMPENPERQMAYMHLHNVAMCRTAYTFISDGGEELAGRFFRRTQRIFVKRCEGKDR